MWAAGSDERRTAGSGMRRRRRGRGGRGECEVARLGLGCWEGKVVAVGFEIGRREHDEEQRRLRGRWVGQYV
jgi:hypothetical protein